MSMLIALLPGDGIGPEVITEAQRVLDDCNGRTGVTPEFPDGIYYYMATDSYPYFSRCVKGL